MSEFDDLEIDLDAVIEDELDEPSAPADLPDWLQFQTVTVGGKDFVLQEPAVGIVLRIINCFGRIGLRGEREATRNLANLLRDEAGQLLRGEKGQIAPAMRALLFGILAVIGEDDLYRLGAAVLQFPDDRAGRKFFEENGLALSPIVRALFINLSLSRDLQESLVDFFGGLDAVGGVLKNLNLL